MAENSKLTGIELNGILYSLGKSIYEEIGISLVRFTELLGRDFYCPTLSTAPTSSTLSYTDTDGESQVFQIGQPCRWADGDKWRISICTSNNGAETSWFAIPIKVSELVNDAGYLTQHQDISHLVTNLEFSDGLSAKQDVINVVEYGTNDTYINLKPNQFHKWGVMSSLAISLVSGDTTDDVYSEYMFEFVSGETATTLSLPAIIKFEDEVVIEPNKTYQVSIVNNIGVIIGV